MDSDHAFVCSFFFLALLHGVTPWLPVTNPYRTIGLPWSGHTIFLESVCFCFLSPEPNSFNRNDIFTFDFQDFFGRSESLQI